MTISEYALLQGVMDERVKKRIEHSVRAGEYGYELGKKYLSLEDAKALRIILQIHDIGKIILNPGVDHGVFGVDLLKENNLIEQFLDSYDKEIITYAILWHNHELITNDNSKKEQIARMVQDADRIDAIARAYDYHEFPLALDEKPTEEVLKRMYDGIFINRNIVKNKVDRTFKLFSLPYQFWYPETLERFSSHYLEFIKKDLTRFDLDTRYQINIEKRLEYVRKKV